MQDRDVVSLSELEDVEVVDTRWRSGVQQDYVSLFRSAIPGNYYSVWLNTQISSGQRNFFYDGLVGGLPKLYECDSKGNLFNDEMPFPVGLDNGNPYFCIIQDLSETAAVVRRKEIANNFWSNARSLQRRQSFPAA